MKRYIRISFIITFVLTMIIILSAFFVLFRREITISIRDSLKITANAVKIIEMPPNADAHDFAQKLSHSGQHLRVTLIDYTGRVVSDSERDEKAMENHASRPEFIEAVKNGYGEDIRISETTHITSIYVSVPLDARYIIRLSLPVSTTMSFMSTMIFVTVLVCIMLLIFIYIFSIRFSQKLIEPFNQISSVLSALVDGSYNESMITSPSFPELYPALSNIRTLSSTLQSNVKEILTKKAQLDNLLKVAEDGILLIAEDGSIISINDAARSILSVPARAANFRTVCRSNDLAELVSLTLQDGSSRVWELDMLETRGHYYRVFINSAKYDQNVLGAVIFISDITEIIRLERMRSEFFANASHELKSPLTSIRGFSELMAADMVPSEEMRRDYARRIMDESERLLSLINDLLHLSELESVKANPRFFKMLDIHSIAEEVCLQLDTQASMKNINLCIKGDGTLFAEQEPIYELLYNLVDNSIKYGRDNGETLITIEETSTALILNVLDSGIGIPQEHLTRIFERFYKIDSARSRKLGSTGLGLAIVKHTAQRYGGTVKAESVVNKYTKMTVQFKKA